MVTEFSIAVLARLSQPRTNTECVLEMIESGKRRFENQIRVRRRLHHLVVGGGTISSPPMPRVD
jgi:hypothetical protein